MDKIGSLRQPILLLCMYMDLREFIISFFMAIFMPYIALATEYTSDSFKVVDPVIDYGGIINSSSDSFKLTGVLGQAAVGTSSSSSFQAKAGFIFFSAATSTPASTPAAAIAAAGSNYSMYLKSLIEGILPFLPPKEFKPCDIAFDLNCDGSVGLKDFSIFLAVQNRPMPNPADFNKDNKIDFKDLSVLLSGWTGKLLSFPEPAIQGVFLAGTAKAPFRGEASIFSLRASEPSLSNSLSQKPAIEKPGFIKTAVQFILNIFVRIKDLFRKST